MTNRSNAGACQPSRVEQPDVSPGANWWVVLAALALAAIGMWSLHGADLARPPPIALGPD